MPPYPYNMDPAFGPVSMITEAEKMRAEMSGGPPPQIKEERNKESSSPHDHPKSMGQVKKEKKLQIFRRKTISSRFSF